MPTFLNPWMLLGGLAVSIPLALHFFYRAHYPAIAVGGHEVLRLSIEQTSRRLRFQELVLLVLRVLVCLLLALALARPAAKTLTGGGSRGESVDAIIVIDTSYSMNALETDKQTRLDKAREAALKIIDNLPPNSTVQIVSCSSKAANVGPRSPSNIDQARKLVKDLKTSSLSTDFLGGFSEALAGFKDMTGASKEVYLISDMQRSGWERQATAIRAKCEEIKNQASIYLVRCAEQKIKNVAIAGILPQTEIPHVDSVVSYTVLLRNSGADAVDNLDVTLEVDGQKEFNKDSVAVTRVEPGQTRAVTIAGKFEKAGWQMLTARINDSSEKKDDGKPVAEKKNRPNQDGLEEDNTYRILVLVHEKIRVLVIDGSPDDDDPSQSGSYYVGHALLPIKEDQRDTYHLGLSVMRPETVGEDALAERDICVLANVNINHLSKPVVAALDGFVRSGKGLLIGSGSNVNGPEYNAALKDLLPAPLVGEGPFFPPRDNPPAADIGSIDIRSFLSKLQEKGNNPFKSLDVAYTGALTPVEDPGTASNRNDLGRVLLRYTDGRPMLLSKIAGAGEVLLLTTSLDATWSILCQTPAFAPFINGCVAQMVQRSTDTRVRTAGEALRWAPPDPRKEYYVIRPDGERVFLGRPKESDHFRLQTFDSSTAGVYRIVAADAREGEGDRFVFNPDLAESDNLEPISDELIDKQLGFEPVHLKTGFDGSSFTGTERSRSEWTIWALVALLIFALGETLFAWFCGRAW